MRPRIRFSIAGLMGVVALLAVGIASFRYPSMIWFVALFNLSAALLLTALLGIIYRRGRKRAFWFGFFLFGVTCLAGCYYFEEFVFSLVAAELGFYLLNRVGVDIAFVELEGVRNALRLTSHAWALLISALLGGIIARCFASTTIDEPDKKVGSP